MSKTLVDKNTGNIIAREVNNSNPDINLSETQISDAVRYAIERAANLDQYDPEVLAETDEWVVGISDTQSANSLSLQLGLDNLEQTEIIDNSYVFKFSDQQTPQEVAQLLEDLPGVEFSYPLVPLPITGTFIPNDPLFANQWHLQNTGQTGGTIGEDANIEAAWDIALGDGVVIGIVDDGLQHTHQDLTNQYRADLSYDFVDDDSNPLSPFDRHGTAVAGIAAANGNNSIGVVGSAPSAELAGLRLFSDFLGTGVTDQDASDALGHENQAVDIYNNSWGFNFFDPVLRPDMPGALESLEEGVNQGRSGLGNIYVWAAGNGRQFNDEHNVNYFGLANSRYTIAVTAIDHNGEQSWYSEPGAPILVAAHSSGDGVGTTTTDLLGSAGYNADGINDAIDYTNQNYTNSFGGTSSAAPLASGVVALMLDTNPNLTWRDVQHILVDTASQNDPTDTDWVTNGAGHLVNHKYGFGAIDADAAVSTASSWTNVEPEDTTSGEVTLGQTIPDNDPTGISSTISITDDLDVEWVEVVFDADHTYRGDLEITLTSPDGTESILAEQRSDSGRDYDNWVFTSARHWDESSLGDWTLTVADTLGVYSGTWNSWELNVYGTGIDEDNYEPNNTRQTAYDLTSQEQVWLSSIDGSGVANNNDWYEIEVLPGEPNLVVDLEFTHADGDIDLALRDSSGSFITSSASVTDDEAISTSLDPGTYYLNVYPFLGAQNAGNTYDLWWGTFAEDDNYEPNNTPDTAYNMTSQEQVWLSSIDGLGIANHEDWYEIQVPAGQENLVVDLEFTHAEGDIDLALYDDSGNEIDRAASVTDDESMDLLVPEAGTYYLNVYPYSGSGNTYDLRWNALPAPADDNYEPNNTLETAYDITGDEQTWLENIDGLGVANDADWYKLETGSGFENLSIHLEFAHADGDIDMALYDEFGDFIASSTSIDNNEHIGVEAPQGIYYLEVYPYSGFGNTYDLWWDDVATL